MKLYILISAFILLSFTKENKNSNDFDFQLSRIVSEFRENIMDKKMCEDLKRKAYNLSSDIQNSIDENSNSSNEVNKLKQLKKEVDAVEEFIGTVGNGGNNMFVKMDLIYLANNRINSSMSTNVKDKFCVEILTITLNEYVAKMMYNKSSNDYTVTYKWKLSNATSIGNGTMGIPMQTIRHMYDNREKPAQKNIMVTNVTCTNIQY
ncbi:MAG: hypothetical protein K9I26_01420 [Flavobacterium sp.]|nr:hypothetical protein [Flavobacterium sp.]